MSKAVLILDMPPCCYACQFCDEDDACLAMSTSTIDVEDILREKPEWCPLVPMPEWDGNDYCSDYARGVRRGRNDALRAIEGND